MFEKDGCYECHGYAGQGGRDGARLAATSMPAPAFVRYVRRPSGAMPAFTQKVLSDQELADIYAYLKSMPAAKPASDIPLLIACPVRRCSSLLLSSTSSCDTHVLDQQPSPELRVFRAQRRGDCSLSRILEVNYVESEDCLGMRGVSDRKHGGVCSNAC